MGQRRFHLTMHPNWEFKKQCHENAIHSKCHAYLTKGSPQSDSSTGNSRKRTKKVNRPKTHVKLGKCSDKQFICPIAVTVKKDQTVKLALNSKKINKFIHKNKYQMPNIELLLVAQTIKSDTKKQAFFRL